jgi:hypothetical protein
MRSGSDHARHHARHVLVPLLALVLVAALAAPVSAARWRLDPDDTEGASAAVDPQNPGNEVVQTTVTTDDPAGRAVVSLAMKSTVQVQELTNAIAAKYYFVSPRQCIGGSPRITLRIQSSLALPQFEGTANAHGVLGDVPFGGVGSCLQDQWVHEDLTNDVTKWDLTQFGGAPNMSWAEVVTFFAGDPGHRVRACSLVDDTNWGPPGGLGTAYYDQVQCGDDGTLSTHKDVTGK